MAELRKASPGSKQRDEALGLNLSGFSLAVLKGICEHSSVQLLSDGSLLLERRPVPLAVVARLLRLDFIEKVEGGVKATEAGRSFVRRHMSSKLEAGYGVSSGAQAGTRGKAKGRGQEGAEDPGIDPYRSQHMQLATDDRILPDGTRGRVRVNGAESPLGWLVRRRGRDGRPMLSQCQFDAGERLREDFERASMGARITSRLDAVPASRQRKGPADGQFVSDMQLDARRRVKAAMEAVGSGLSDVLIRVCCHLEGLEEAEKVLGWPARSGKLVLGIALDRLAAHYGMENRDMKGAEGCKK